MSRGSDGAGSCSRIGASSERPILHAHPAPCERDVRATAMGREYPPSAVESSAMTERLRSLPSVEELASSASVDSHELAVAAARQEIYELRTRILDGDDAEVSRADLTDAV